jgi:hypothetical protein
MPIPSNAASAIRPAQLRRLQALWRRWTRSLRLPPEEDRRLRHYYVRAFTAGRARETLELDSLAAAQVIAWLERLTAAGTPAQRSAAGTAGRRGFPERRRIRTNSAAWRALWGVAGALGMSRGALDRFIARHYAARGLRSTADLRSMADLNRVLWGLKAILRRGPHPARALRKKAA